MASLTITGQTKSSGVGATTQRGAKANNQKDSEGSAAEAATLRGTGVGSGKDSGAGIGPGIN